MSIKARQSSGRKTKQRQTDDIEALQGEVYHTAQRYVAAGISLIPIAADRQKRPCFPLLPRRTDEKSGESKATWKPFQTRLPTTNELAAWYKPGQASVIRRERPTSSWAAGTSPGLRQSLQRNGRYFSRRRKASTNTPRRHAPAPRATAGPRQALCGRATGRRLQRPCILA